MAGMAGKLPRELGDDLLATAALRNNAGVMGFVRTLASLVAGLALGIWGITGWVGFLYYFGIHVVVSALLLLKVGFNPTPYFQSRQGLFLGEVFSQTSLLTFILFWTLAHNTIHLF